MRKTHRDIKDCHIVLGRPRRFFVGIFLALVGVLFLATFCNALVYIGSILFFCAGLGALTQASFKYQLIDAIGVSSGRWFVLTNQGKKWLQLLHHSIVLKGLLFLHFYDLSKKPFNVIITPEMTKNQADFCTLARYAKLSSSFSDFAI